METPVRRRSLHFQHSSFPPSVRGQGSAQTPRRPPRPPPTGSREPSGIWRKASTTEGDRKEEAASAEKEAQWKRQPPSHFFSRWG